MNDERDSGRRTRRAVLRTGAFAGATALAGCFGGGDGGDGAGNGSDGGDGNETIGNGDGELTLADFRGSGTIAGTRPDLEAVSMDDLPDLSGTLSIYLGGGEGGLYVDLVNLLKRKYPDFDPRVRSAPSSQLANTLIEESQAGATRADVFWAVDAGALSIVADRGQVTQLSGDVVSSVPETFRPNGDWVGVAGRARAVPYNTDRLSADDIPDSVMAFPETSALSNGMGWAPSYGAFQSFVTAMRLLEGESATKEWLRGMQSQGVTQYPNEFLVSNATADGELAAGFANHYYALRVKAARPNAPLDLAFTSGDAGALINVSGAEILGGSDRTDLARTFVDHLLTAEAQEFFATRTFAYPMVPGVPPVGGLPTVDELEPPSLDLSKLSDLQPTLRLLRDVGVL